MGELIWFMPGR